ncbi:MAG: transcriptional repressor LexA [Sedimenticola sp.]
MQKLTKTQINLLNAITKLKESLGMSPTVKEIANELSIQPPSVYEALRRLENKGYIRRAPRKARSIEIIKSITPTTMRMVAVQIIGKVAAGTPILATENRTEDVMVPQDVVRGNCFALEVQGDSMIEANIFEGDYIVVRQQPIAENNDIVVAMIGDEATVKRLFISEDRIELRPEKAGCNRSK